MSPSHLYRPPLQDQGHGHSAPHHLQLHQSSNRSRTSSHYLTVLRSLPQGHLLLHSNFHHCTYRCPKAPKHLPGPLHLLTRLEKHTHRCHWHLQVHRPRHLHQRRRSSLISQQTCRNWYGLPFTESSVRRMPPFLTAAARPLAEKGRRYDNPPPLSDLWTTCLRTRPSETHQGELGGEGGSLQITE